MARAPVAAASVVAWLVLQAGAHASQLAGFSVGANVNFASSSAQISAAGSSARVGDTAQNASLYAAYGFDWGARAVLSLGLSYYLTSLKSGSLVMAGSNAELRNNDMYSAYIEPAYVLNDATLLYAKIAYVGAKGERILNGLIGSQNYYGVGYGAGARALLTRHLYLQAEFLRSEYGERPIDGMPYKPSSTTGSIGLGYKF